jgi:hypothetical protein
MNNPILFIISSFEQPDNPPIFAAPEVLVLPAASMSASLRGATLGPVQDVFHAHYMHTKKKRDG